MTKKISEISVRLIWLTSLSPWQRTEPSSTSTVQEKYNNLQSPNSLHNTAYNQLFKPHHKNVKRDSLLWKTLLSTMTQLPRIKKLCLWIQFLTPYPVLSTSLADLNLPRPRTAQLRVVRATQHAVHQQLFNTERNFPSCSIQAVTAATRGLEAAAALHLHVLPSFLRTLLRWLSSAPDLTRV